MPSIYLAKFRQAPYIGVAAHWGIFVPYESSPQPIDGTPGVGKLFHASMTWERCLELHLFSPGATYWEIREGYDLQSSRALLSCIRLDSTNVSDAQVSAACTYVSGNRPFHYLTQNCQDWVKDVIAQLVVKKCLNASVFEYMELQGYKSLRDSDCIKSCQKSSFCWCKWKRR
jgi:hypothetical protein